MFTKGTWYANGVFVGTSKHSDDIVSGVGDHPIEEQKANAMLIAASKELLFSLEEMVADWDDELSQEAQIDFVGRAREAIKKARGL